MGFETTEFWIDPNAARCGALAADWFATLWADADTPKTRHFALPGIALTVESAGTEVGALLTAAFKHLETDGPAPEGEPLTWRIGDANTPGALAQFPPLPTTMHELGNFNTCADGDLFVERRRGLVSVYDHRSRIITSICEGAESLENDLIAKPLLRFLMGVLQQQGIYLAHAALVGLNGQGLLVTGKGGMGKSTISSVALGNGLSFCSDDFVALQRVGDEIIGHSLYATLLLHPDQVAHHPHFQAHCRASTSAEVPKTVVILGDAFKDQTVACLRIDAIAVPKISADPLSSLQPLSWVAAIRALTPTSVFSSPWREVDQARFLIELAGDVSCYEYVSGSDYSKISDPVRDRYA